MQKHIVLSLSLLLLCSSTTNFTMDQDESKSNDQDNTTFGDLYTWFCNQTSNTKKDWLLIAQDYKRKTWSQRVHKTEKTIRKILRSTYGAFDNSPREASNDSEISGWDVAREYFDQSYGSDGGTPQQNPEINYSEKIEDIVNDLTIWHRDNQIDY